MLTRKIPFTNYCGKQAECAAPQERLQAARKERAQHHDKHAELKKTTDEERLAWIADMKTLEDMIIDFRSDSEKHAETDHSSRENEIRPLESAGQCGLFLGLETSVFYLCCRLRKSVIPTKSSLAQILLSAHSG